MSQLMYYMKTDKSFNSLWVFEEGTFNAVMNCNSKELNN